MYCVLAPMCTYSFPVPTNTHCLHVPACARSFMQFYLVTKIGYMKSPEFKKEMFKNVMTKNKITISFHVL